MLDATQIRNPALRPLADLFGDRYVTAATLARRYVWSTQHLANLRRADKGPAYTIIGRSVRYRMAEVLAWELNGQSAHITRERVALACSTLPGFGDAEKARIIAHLEQALGG